MKDLRKNRMKIVELKIVFIDGRFLEEKLMFNSFRGLM